jgi:hypothetical protein
MVPGGAVLGVAVFVRGRGAAATGVGEEEER